MDAPAGLAGSNWSLLVADGGRRPSADPSAQRLPAPYWVAQTVIISPSPASASFAWSAETRYAGQWSLGGHLMPSSRDIEQAPMYEQSQTEIPVCDSGCWSTSDNFIAYISKLILLNRKAEDFDDSETQNFTYKVASQRATVFF